MTVVSGGNGFPGKLRLDGLTALVTGGGRGIGAATAGTLACAGARSGGDEPNPCGSRPGGGGH